MIKEITIKLKPYFIILIIPAASLFALVALTVISGKILYAKLTELNLGLEDVKKQQTVMAEKLSILRGIDDSSLATKEDILFAIPVENPTLIVLEEIRARALESSVRLEKLKVGFGTQETSGVNETGLDLDGTGDFLSLVSFLESLKRIAPVTKIGETSFSQGINDQFRLSSKLTVYWSPYTANISDISSPIDILSEDDNKILDEASKLSKPQSLTNNVSVSSEEDNLSVPIGRANPFSL